MRGGDQGSIFVESLVAVAIVALMLGALMQLVSQSAVRQGQAEDRRAAWLVARSQLDAAGASIPVAAGRTTGQTGMMIWEVSASGADDSSPSAVARLSRVTVTVRRRGGGVPLAQLSTLRVMGPP